MSTGDGGDRTPPDDDPFAFEPDEHDEHPTDAAPEGPEDPAAPADPDDPFAFEPDEHDTGADDHVEAPVAGPPGRSSRRTRRSAADVAAEAEEARVARAREVAEEAAAKARSVGVRWLAVAAVIFVVVVGITTITGGRDAQGGDVEPGETLPAFAAPLVSQPRLENEDVNLATKDGQGEAGKVAACSIRNRSVVTSCALLARGPLVLVLFSRGIGDCVGAVDQLDTERRRFPGIQTLAVSLLGRHDSTGETARDRRWTLPVAYDRDGGLASVLGAPACPLVLFVRPDGTVQQRIIGRLKPGALVQGMRDLLTPPAGAGSTVDAVPPGR